MVLLSRICDFVAISQSHNDPPVSHFCDLAACIFPTGQSVGRVSFENSLCVKCHFSARPRSVEQGDSQVCPLPHRWTY